MQRTPQALDADLILKALLQLKLAATTNEFTAAVRTRPMALALLINYYRQVKRASKCVLSVL
jgi:hypothetical protein